MANVIIGEKRVGGARIRSSGGMAILEETYEYLVRSDDKNNTRLEILITSGLPLVNITVASHGYTVCRTKDARRDENNIYLWHVICEFSSEVDERQSGQDPASDPNEWIPVYETKYERLQEIVSVDRNGDVVANSAGQHFENGLTISRFIPIWEFYQFEEATIDDEDIIERNEKVNSGTFKGRPAKSLLLNVLSSVVGFYYGERRRLTKYQIKYNEKLWTHKRKDIGTIYLDGGVAYVYTKKIKNENEEIPISGPLDGSGGKAADGAGPAILEFDLYDEINFSSFLRV